MALDSVLRNIKLNCIAILKRSKKNIDKWENRNGTLFFSYSKWSDLLTVYYKGEQIIEYEEDNINYLKETNLDFLIEINNILLKSIGKRKYV